MRLASTKKNIMKTEIRFRCIGIFQVSFDRCQICASMTSIIDAYMDTQQTVPRMYNTFDQQFKANIRNEFKYFFNKLNEAKKSW